MFTYKSNSPKETAGFGAQLARILQPGMVVLLNGDLGVGKTALAQGILHALGVEEHVTSPTYTLVNEYEGRVPIAHFDLYRLDDPDELFDIGFDEYLDNRRVVLIEWPERAGGYLPPEYLLVEISGTGSEREIIIEGVGTQYRDVDEEMKSFVSTGN